MQGGDGRALEVGLVARGKWEVGKIGMIGENERRAKERQGKRGKPM